MKENILPIPLETFISAYVAGSTIAIMHDPETSGNFKIVDSRSLNPIYSTTIMAGVLNKTIGETVSLTTGTLVFNKDWILH